MPVEPKSGQLEQDYVVSQIFQKFEELFTRIERLENGAKMSQLPFSSVDTDKGNGFIPFYAGGVEKARIGRMPDGTYTTASVNNKTPPSIPTEPLVIPVIGGLMVAVESLDQAIPYDFSHLNIYCDGLIDGTITRVPGYWVIAPLDPSTTHNVQVTAVNQSGTESTKSVSVIAKPLTVVDEIDLNGINETLIEDESITTPKIAALAITTAKLLANIIEATHIKTGAVTAEKLAAIIVMAQKRFICGNPVGKRVEINESGIEQYDELGHLLMQLGGSTSVKANFLTIPNPEDPYDFLATLDEKGNLSVNGLSIWSDPIVYGVPLSDVLDRFPKGTLAYGSLNFSDPEAPDYTTLVNQLGNTAYGPQPLFELSAQVEKDRIYRIAMGGTVAASMGHCIIEIKYTTDGSKPTINSPTIGYGYYADDFYAVNRHIQYNQPSGINTTAASGHTHGIPFFQGKTTGPTEINITPTQSGQLRILFSRVPRWGTGFHVSGYSLIGAAQFFIEDRGPKVTSTGGYPTDWFSQQEINVPNRKTIDYNVTAHKVWRSNALGTPLASNAPDAELMRQGGSPTSYYITKFTFNTTQMVADLTGTTIEKIELFMYCSFSEKSEGGKACIYPSSNYPSNVFSAQDINEKLQTFSRPEGKWVELPLEVGERLRQGLSDSFVLFPGKFRQFAPDYLDPIYSMLFSPFNDTSADRRPKIRFTFRRTE